MSASKQTFYKQKTQKNKRMLKEITFRNELSCQHKMKMKMQNSG